MSALNVIPIELRGAIRTLQQSLLLCRPRDTITFAVRYLHDEKSDNSAYHHAVHSLPFLLQIPDLFRSTACTVFCGIKSQRTSCDRTDIRDVARASATSVIGCSQPLQQIAAPAGRGKQLSDSKTDSKIVSVQNPDESDAAAVDWQVDVIDSVLKEHLKSLERFDFESFVVTLRLYLSCWIIVLWVQSMIAQKLGSFSELATSLKRCVALLSPNVFLKHLDSLTLISINCINLDKNL